MPYDSYTNDSDAQLAAQIDRFKLGPGVARSGASYEDDSYAASEAAMDSMGNNYKNVADLMQARASLGGQSMEMRRRISEDNVKKQEADEFDSFLTASKDDYIPGDDIGNAQRMQQRQHDFRGNKLIDDALGKSFIASSFTRKGREEASAALDWQHTENLREEKEKTDTITTRLVLKDKERLEKNYDAAISSDESNKVMALGQAMSPMLEKDPDLFDKVNAVATRLAETGKFTEIDELSNMMKTYSCSYLLDEAYAPDIARIQSLSSPFKEFGIELAVNDPIKKKEAYALAEAKVNEILSNPSISEVEKTNWKKNFDELTKKDATLTKIQTERGGAQAMLRELFTDPPKDMSSPEALEWKVKKNIALMRMGGLDGLVKSQFEERDRNTALIERNLELESKHLANTKTRQGIKLAADNQELRNTLADMRRDQMSIDRMAVVLRSANLVDSKNIRSQDDLIELLDGLMPEIDRMLEEGLPDVGVSGYKK